MRRPTVNQTVSQLAPMFLLLGGLLVFKERFTARQWAGFALLLMGLLLFFQSAIVRAPRLVWRAGSGGYAVGHRGDPAGRRTGWCKNNCCGNLNSQQILWLIYLGAIVVLLPAASPGAVRDLNALQAWMLAFLLSEHPDRVRRIRGSPGALGGVSRQRRAGADTGVHNG